MHPGGKAWEGSAQFKEHKTPQGLRVGMKRKVQKGRKTHLSECFSWTFVIPTELKGDLARGLGHGKYRQKEAITWPKKRSTEGALLKTFCNATWLYQGVVQGGLNHWTGRTWGWNWARVSLAASTRGCCKRQSTELGALEFFWHLACLLPFFSRLMSFVVPDIFFTWMYLYAAIISSLNLMLDKQTYWAPEVSHYNAFFFSSRLIFFVPLNLQHVQFFNILFKMWTPELCTVLQSWSHLYCVQW